MTTTRVRRSRGRGAAAAADLPEGHQPAPVRVAPSELAPACGHFVAPDGVEIYFEDSGGPGPVLFYVYGLGCSIKHWKYPLAHFAEGGAAAGRHRQIWLDFRGHGRSARPSRGERLSIAGIVGDIEALCAERGVGRATFLGQSMGGSIVLALARKRPDLVAAVVLLGAPGRDPARDLPFQPVAKHAWRVACMANALAPGLVSRINEALTPWRDLPAARFVLREVIRQNGFNAELSRTEDIDEYIDQMLAVHPNLFFDLADDLRRFDVATFDPPVTCPALLVAGENDQLVPLAEARRLAGLLPASRLEVIPNGSHCPHFDDPGRINRLIEDFLVARGL